MNTGSSKTLDPRRLLLNLSDKINLKILASETMKLLGSTKSKITKVKHGENVPHLEITEIVLVHYDIVNNDYQHD